MTETTPITTPFKWETTAAEVVGGIDLGGSRVIVTGGASGIGLETARALATVGAEVTLAVRDADAGQRVAAAIVASSPNTHVFVAPVDLANPASVASLVAAWDGPLDVLVNNAGVMACPQTRTPQGWELQFSTNHLGHFALATGLHRALAAAGGARIVSVSSRAHLRSPVIFDDIHFLQRAYEPWDAYAQSKTANVLFAVEATRRWANDGIRPGAGPTTASPLTPCSRAPSGRTCSATSPMRTWSSPAYTSKTTVAVSTGRHPSREPRHRCCSRPHRCSRGSAAATSKTVTRQDQASQAPVAASPPTRSTPTRRSDSGKSPSRRWHPDSLHIRSALSSRGPLCCWVFHFPPTLDYA